MTARALLAELRRRGIRLAAAGGRLRYRPASQVPPELQALMAQHKSALIALLEAEHRALGPVAQAALAYHTHLRSGFALIADSEASPEGCRQFLDEEMRLVDALGPAHALEILRATAHAWTMERNSCPWCGQAGVGHEPEPESELAQLRANLDPRA